MRHAQDQVMDLEIKVSAYELEQKHDAAIREQLASLSIQLADHKDRYTLGEEEEEEEEEEEDDDAARTRRMRTRTRTRTRRRRRWWWWRTRTRRCLTSEMESRGQVAPILYARSILNSHLEPRPPRPSP